MSIFKIHNSNLIPIKEAPLSLERDLQKITENNLQIIFGLNFISSEFSLHQFRIDTLAFDEETKSFVIIEYKRDKSFSVIDQGYAYLALMLNNKADFILEYNEKKKDNLKKENIDWSQSRVLFLANSFTVYQQNAINFKDLPIELWEVKKYNNEIILYNQLKSTDSKESIKTISKSKTIESVSREIKKYSVDDHFREEWKKSRELFNLLSEKIFNLDSRIKENSNPKNYIGYKIDNTRICDVHIYRNKLKIDLMKVDVEDLNDPENKTTKMPWREYNWSKQCNYEIKNIDDVDYAIFLIKQIYQKFYK